MEYFIPGTFYLIDKKINITLAKWEKNSFSLNYTRHSNNLTAPVVYSDILGSISIFLGKDELSAVKINIDVTAESSVIRKTYTDHLSDMIKSLPYVFG